MIPVENYSLAKGLVYINSGSCEFGCEYTELVYAVINGKEYGRRITEVKKEDLVLPNDYVFYQNYPNPFNPATVISFYIPEESDIKLLVYDLKGELIQTLVDENLKSGKYIFKFDASDYSSGLYFYTLVTNEVILSKKMLLIK